MLSALFLGLLTCTASCTPVQPKPRPPTQPPLPPQQPGGPPKPPAPSLRPLPSTFTWNSTGPIIGSNPTTDVAALKDPSVVFFEGKYHVFVSTARADGYNLAYLSFPTFDSASNATITYLEQTAIGPGYRAAPQVFYFAPQKLWYLVFQNGNAAYSTNPDINDPQGWSAVTNFFPDGTPQIILDNIGAGFWLDMWVICDEVNCHLFSSDDNGQLYRSQTTVADFPNGFGNTVITLQDPDRFRLFEASNVYEVAKGQYLLLVEAIGTDGFRYFRSWTASDLAGNWTALAAEEDLPFARSNNVLFTDSVEWTKSISHGEIVRREVDQRLRVSRCGWEYLYQGLAPDATGDYNSLPWKLGLLTQTSSC
ncbi:glycosyl hydrolase family 62 protein [Elsinoe ampelina]|uniref:Alpha-L-arabinofuranosidase n=1 Tax=Elsinoe ampelina TaxID=302913 RepID=A0A6A6GDZ0_9PEZI|nr:glycosyl hydrolase family 62 protein [Elsinoe ampelina]